MLDVRTNLPKRSGNSISSAISAAFLAKGFNPSYADAFAAWYFNENAKWNGEVPGERPSTDSSRTELTNRATAFSTDQAFSIDDIPNASLGSDDTDLTFSVWVRGGAFLADDDRVMSCEESGKGYFIGLDGTAFVVAAYDGSGTLQTASTGLSKTDLQSSDAKGYWVKGIYDHSESKLYCSLNGKRVAETTCTGFTATTSNTLSIGRAASGTARNWEGEINHCSIWVGTALSPADDVLHWDRKWSQLTTPTKHWLLNGDEGWDQIGDDHLTPENGPSLSEDKDNATSPFDFNHAGQSAHWISTGAEVGPEIVGAPIESGVDISLEIKTTATSGIVFGNDSIGTPWVVAWSDGSATNTLYSGGLSATITVDDIVYVNGVNTRGDLASVIATGEWVRITISGLNTSTFSNGLFLAGYNVGSQLWNGHVRNLVINGVSYAPPNPVPAQWGSTTLDAEGNTLQYSGEVARNGQLENGPCLTCDGTNQGLTTYDASGRTTLSGTTRLKLTDTTDDQYVFDQSDGTVGWGFRTRNIDASTYSLTFFHYPAEGGPADVIDASTVLNINQEYTVGFSWAASSGDVDFFVDDGKETAGGPTSTGILADSTEMALLNGNDVTSKGIRGNIWDLRIFEGTLSQDEFDWVRTCGSGTEPSNMVRHWPVIEESGNVLSELVAEDHVTISNGPTWGDQDSFFHGEHYGCNSVPIFEDGIALFDATDVNFDGVKTCVIELDYFVTDASTNQVLLTIGFVSPFYIRIGSSDLSVIYRSSSNTTLTKKVIDDGILSNTLYKHKITITEDEDNPTTASSIVITDRITGEVLGSKTGLDIAISSVTSNSGDVQLGNYANESQTFAGNLYRARFEMGGIEKLLWKSDNYLVNQTDDSAMAESGGTLGIKKIPAKEDGSNTDANGYPIQNTLPSHKGTQATLRGYLADSDSEADIYYGAEFDGTSSEITMDAARSQVSVASDFSGSVQFKFGGSPGSRVLLDAATASSDRFVILITSGQLVVGAYNGSTYAKKSVAFSDTASFHTLVFSYDSTGHTINATLDGVEMTGTESPASSGSVGMRLGRFSASGWWDGAIKNLKIDGGSDCPLYKDSLDRSSNCNHGTDTDITYLNTPATEIAALEPEIAETETLCETSGDRKLILIGAK